MILQCFSFCFKSFEKYICNFEASKSNTKFSWKDVQKYVTGNGNAATSVFLELTKEYKIVQKRSQTVKMAVG